MSPEEKIENIEKQLGAIEDGRTNVLNCPYCGVQTKQGEVLCCMTMGKAVRAILQRQTTGELAEKAERIAEAIHASCN